LILKRGAEAVPVVSPHRILKPETAITMRKMMEGVVLVGTGKKAKLSGYSTAGKTGSAQIFDYATGRYTHSYNASFMGFAPVTNPAIVVVATLNGTHGTAGFGGAVAAPVFHDVAAEALRVLDVPRDLPDNTPDPPDTQIADLNDAPVMDGATDPPVLEEAEVQAPEAPNAGQRPAPPATPAPRPSGPTAPNFIGLSMRSVVAMAQAQGLPLTLAGTGIVRTQDPPPGAVLHGGERIRVDLAR
jgi:cell division protein FtsI (penicillin-binding protein 3)